MTFKKHVFTAVATALFTCIALPALALNLNQARTQGLVGELKTGYVGAVNAGSGVNELVEEVNAKRLDAYRNISKENGQPVETVARLAYPQIVQNLPSGALYQNEQGGWVKK